MEDAATIVLTLLVEFMAIFLVVTFAVHLLVLSVPAARLQRAMAGRPGRAMALALLFGAVTPFCSCSTVPVVAGMAAAGVPVGAMTAFLVVSPLVNPATVALLATLVSPLYAGGFVVASMALATIVAAVMTLLRVRPTLDAALRPSAPVGPPIGIAERARVAARRSGRDLRALTPLLGGVALVGALLYGRVDVGLIGRAIESAGPWAVPVAVLVGVPVYASTALLLPLGSALLATGANLGVVTAFLIGATGLSVPEGIMLQRLLGTRYLSVLAAAFLAAAVTVGYAVQALAPAGG
jgi:uncharacterized protein